MSRIVRRVVDAITFLREVYRLDLGDDAWLTGLQLHGLELGERTACFGDTVALHPRVERGWSSLVPHIAAAFRLRRRLAEVVPSGAKGSCALREAIVASARLAEGTERSLVPTEVPSFWPALVAGELSLVDQWDAEGRRYVLVHQGRHGALDPRALTVAEARIARDLLDGASVKEIAADTNVAVSTVTTLASRVYRKLGIERRSALVRLARTTLANAVYAPLGQEDMWLVSEPVHTRAALPAGVSPALVDVLERLVTGQSSGDIARARGTSLGTIDKQITKLYAALRVRSRAELSAWWATRASAPPARSE